MKPEMTTLQELEIFEQDAFKRADIKLLDLSLHLLKDHRMAVIPHSTGLARLVNLLHWDASENLEYLDGEGVLADQIIHFAVHHVMNRFNQCNTAKGMLFAECMASAADVYLVGKLSQAGEETDFLQDTLESFSTYYEMYAVDETHLELMLSTILEQPFKAMMDLANYLFQFGSALLGAQPDLEKLIQLQEHFSYPLVHHYNISNWILTIRSKFPGYDDAEPDLSTIRTLFCDSENAFLEQFQ